MVLIDERNAGGFCFVDPFRQALCCPGNAVLPIDARVVLSGGDAQKADTQLCCGVDVAAELLPVLQPHGRIGVRKIGIGHHASNDYACVLRLPPQSCQIRTLQRVQMGHADVGPVQADLGGQAEPVGQRALAAADVGVEGGREAGKRHSVMTRRWRRPHPKMRRSR